MMTGMFSFLEHFADESAESVIQSCAKWTSNIDGLIQAWEKQTDSTVSLWGG